MLDIDVFPLPDSKRTVFMSVAPNGWPLRTLEMDWECMDQAEPEMIRALVHKFYDQSQAALDKLQS